MTSSSGYNPGWIHLQQVSPIDTNVVGGVGPTSSPTSYGDGSPTNALGLSYEPYSPSVAPYQTIYPSPPYYANSELAPARYYDQQQAYETASYTPPSPSTESTTSSYFNASRTVGDLVKKAHKRSSSLQHSPPAYHGSVDVAFPAPAVEPAQPLPFITKLRYILSRDDLYGDVIRWDAAGENFIVVHKSPKLVKDVLPHTYQHCNYPSFTRQLNIYGFLRSPQTSLSSIIDTSDPCCLPLSAYHVWSHPSFSRDDNISYMSMKPRPSLARVREREEKAVKKRRKLSTDSDDWAQ